MNKLLIPSLLAILAFTSCKKDNNKSTQTTTTTNQTITITDSVKIGSLWWTTVNYNGTGGVNYGDSTKNVPTHGKLYTIAEASKIKLPGGWRLPTVDDYNTLIKTIDPSTNAKDAQGNYIGGQDDAALLMSTSLWIKNFGTNASGFNAIPVGIDYDNGNAFGEGLGSGSYLVAGFLTQSQFMNAVNGHVGHAEFFIYQDYITPSSLTQTVITSLDADGTNGQGRASIRFVRNN
jgi:uncharacterized protein (TIGR02145 family)